MLIVALYVAVALAWLGIAILATPAVYSIFRGTRRFGDGARLVVWSWSLLMLGFIGRRIAIDRAGDPVLVALMLASLGVAFLTWRTAKGYGRGWPL